jgi:hypothetical protein
MHKTNTAQNVTTIAPTSTATTKYNLPAYDLHNTEFQGQECSTYAS